MTPADKLEGVFGPFAAAPLAFLALDMPASWKLLVIVVHRAACWPRPEAYGAAEITSAEITRLTGLSAREIRYARAGLRKRGLLEYEQRRGRGRGCRYLLRLPDDLLKADVSQPSTKRQGLPVLQTEEQGKSGNSCQTKRQEMPVFPPKTGKKCPENRQSLPPYIEHGTGGTAYQRGQAACAAGAEEQDTSAQADVSSAFRQIVAQADAAINRSVQEVPPAVERAPAIRPVDPRTPEAEALLDGLFGASWRDARSTACLLAADWAPKIYQLAGAIRRSGTSITALIEAAADVRLRQAEGRVRHAPAAFFGDPSVKALLAAAAATAEGA